MGSNKLDEYALRIDTGCDLDAARVVLRELVLEAENSVIAAIAADFEASDAGKGIGYAALKISKRIHDGHSCLLDSPSEGTETLKSDGGANG